MADEQQPAKKQKPDTGLKNGTKKRVKFGGDSEEDEEEEIVYKSAASRTRNRRHTGPAPPETAEDEDKPVSKKMKIDDEQ